MIWRWSWMDELSWFIGWVEVRKMVYYQRSRRKIFFDWPFDLIGSIIVKSVQGSFPSQTLQSIDFWSIVGLCIPFKFFYPWFRTHFMMVVLVFSIFVWKDSPIVLDVALIGHFQVVDGVVVSRAEVWILESDFVWNFVFPCRKVLLSTFWHALLESVKLTEPLIFHEASNVSTLVLTTVVSVFTWDHFTCSRASPLLWRLSFLLDEVLRKGLFLLYFFLCHCFVLRSCSCL